MKGGCMALLKKITAQKILDMSKSGLEKLVANDPTFPKPIKIGAKAIGWIESEIEAWLAAQISKSRGAE